MIFKDIFLIYNNLFLHEIHVSVSISDWLNCRDLRSILIYTHFNFILPIFFSIEILQIINNAQVINVFPRFTQE